MPTILMPTRRKPDAIERLAQGLGIAQNAVNLGASIYDIGTKVSDRNRMLEQEKEQNDPNSPLAQSFRERAQQAEITLPMGSAKEYQQLGLVGYVQEREKASRDLASKKELSDYDNALQIKRDRARAADEFRFAQAKGAINPNKMAFEHLPMENQELVKDLSKKNANKISIANNIDSALRALEDPKISQDQKIITGRQLLKVLNSAEGQDAIGSEEAKRLGGLLEFKFANLTQPGPMFGRDVEGFTDQVKLKTSELKDAVARNKAEINKLYGRAPDYKEEPLPNLNREIDQSGNAHAGPGEATFTEADLDALLWLEKNPNSADAPGIRKILQSKGLK